MQKANIFLVECDFNLIGEICENLRDQEHKIVLVRGHLDGVKNIIKNCGLGGVDIAVIAGYFPNFNILDEPRDNGQDVEEMIKREYPNIKTIVFSSIVPSKKEYGDVYVWKLNGVKALLEAIEKI